MCGLCGIYGTGAANERRSTVFRMVSTLVHRGPDAQGVFVAEGIALGHRRLSVLDLSPNGAQPMSLGESGPTITYNGEVYNFAELRKELEKEGRLFRGHSDTEVMLHAYDAWGLDGLKRFDGIFAFALWDSSRRRLVLMRDRLGIKPMFYAWLGDKLAFGSEIKAVLAAVGVDRALDDQALAEYLWYGNAFEDRTIYRAIRSVPAGHWLIVEDGRARLEAWWRLEEWLERSKAPRDAREAADRVRDAVDAAVSRQLVSDVPVGIFLSGGVDSSTIAASAVRTLNRPLASFSVGFDFDGGINELPKARRLAKILGLDHHELQVRASDLEDVLVRLVRAHDEPFADAANIPLYLLAKALNGGMKVVLQGDGGDEMFAGYRRYSILRHVGAWRRWPRWLTQAVRSALGGYGARFARMADAAGEDDPAMRMALLLTVETLKDPPTAMLQPETRAHLERSSDPFLAFRRCEARYRSADPVQQMLLTDMSLQLPSQFLAKVDRATMAHGLEARVPLLDERVAELVVGLPSAFKVRGFEKKIVLRDAMRDRLPAEVLEGPKTGFGVPYEHWLRDALHGLAREAILAPDFVARFGLDRKRLESALVEHQSGRRNLGFLLWKFFQLALWAREYR